MRVNSDNLWELNTCRKLSQHSRTLFSVPPGINALVYVLLHLESVLALTHFKQQHYLNSTEVTVCKSQIESLRPPGSCHFWAFGSPEPPHVKSGYPARETAHGEDTYRGDDLRLQGRRERPGQLSISAQPSLPALTGKESIYNKAVWMFQPQWLSTTIRMRDIKGNQKMTTRAAQRIPSYNKLLLFKSNF